VQTLAPPSRESRLAVVLAMTALMGGCAGERTLVREGSAHVVSPDLALVSLGPNAPATLSVVERPYANATRQTIALATEGKTPGQNELRVDIFGVTNKGVGPETTLSDVPLKEDELLSEAQDALPSVPMRISLNYLQNRYGPFGYAIGRSPRDDLCVYAWQRLATPEQKLSLINSRVAASVRLRLCDPHATEASLVASMMNLNIDATLSGGGWTPDPRELSADLGAPGAPQGPPAIMEAYANPLSSKAVAVERRPRKTPVRQARQPIEAPALAAPALQAPPGFVVPPPPPTAAAPAPQSPAVAVPAPPSEPRS
jgi:Cellulose biosynthesis protein BcsN